jgi:hypothetical protein
MGCTECKVQPTALQTLIEVMIPWAHVNTSILEANEAKSRECGESKIVPLGHQVVIRVILLNAHIR